MHSFNISASLFTDIFSSAGVGREGQNFPEKSDLITSDLPASIVRIMTPLLCPRKQEALPIQCLRMTQKDSMALFQLISSSSFTPPPSCGIKVLPVPDHPHWLRSGATHSAHSSCCESLKSAIEKFFLIFFLNPAPFLYFWENKPFIVSLSDTRYSWWCCHRAKKLPVLGIDEEVASRGGLASAIPNARHCLPVEVTPRALCQSLCSLAPLQRIYIQPTN